MTRQDDTPNLKTRKQRVIADPNGITVPAKIVRVKKGRKKDKAPIMDDCSMELDEVNSTPYVPKSVGPLVGSSESERIPELPKNVSLSAMSGAHHFGIHGGEIVSAGRDIHINKYSSPNAERSVDRVPTLPTVSESEISTSRNTAQEASGSITDLQFPNVIQMFSIYFQGIRRRLVPSQTTVDDIMHSPVVLVDSPTAMIPEDTQTYSRLMLQLRQGYPLYRSTPIRGVSETHWKKGVRIGDVGRVRPDGSFEFLFNINPNETDTRLPDGFEKLHHVDSFQEPNYYSRGEHLLKGSVKQTKNSPMTYKFSASGAILQLPEGAVHLEAQNKNDFSSLASQYAQRWYEYMNVDRSMGAPNGSLYLITGCIKCTSCATAVFSEPHVGENWLEFHYEGLRARPTYIWRKMGPMIATVNQNQEDLGIVDVKEPRQCVFIRGFKIALGDKEWNQLIKIAVTRHSSQDRFVEASGSSGAANHAAKDGNDSSHQTVSDNNGDTEGSPIIQQLSSSASPIHPSDFINAILLQRNPEAKVAVTHDDDWLGLFPEDHSVDPFSLPVDAVLKILDEASSTVDEHGCVSLVKIQQEPPTNMKTAITRSNGQGRKVLSRIENPTPRPTASRAIHKSASSLVSKDRNAQQKTTEPRIGHRLSTRQSDRQILNKVKKSGSAKGKRKVSAATFSASTPGGGATFGFPQMLDV